MIVDTRNIVYVQFMVYEKMIVDNIVNGQNDS